MIQFILLCNLKNYLLEVIKSAFSKYQFANAHPVDCWRASWCQFNWTIITLSFYYIYMPRSTVILCKLNCKLIQWLLGLSIVLASLFSGPPSFIYPWIGPVCFSLIFFWNSKSHPSTVPPLMPPTSLLPVGERIYYRILYSLLTPNNRALHFFLVTSDLSSSDLSVLQLPKDSYLWLHKPFGGCSFYSSLHLFCTMNICVFFVFLGGMFHFSVHSILFNIF